MRNREKQRDDERCEQLEVVGVQPEAEHDLDDNVIEYRAEDAACELRGEVARPVAENDLADDDRRKAVTMAPRPMSTVELPWY